MFVDFVVNFFQDETISEKPRQMPGFLVQDAKRNQFTAITAL